ncbi:MAG: ABC transporter permease [Desulfobacterales bacterium]|nr:ABC transporter permease [Desulfobacterales bacterium]
MNTREKRLGILSSLPLSILLLLTFIAPLAAIAAFSVMPEKVFTLAHVPDFSAYSEFVREGYWKSLAWSLGMAAVATGVLVVICWPLAYAMVRIFKRFTLIITILVVMTLFVSENIRLFGWVITLMKGGLLEGYMRAWTGSGFDGLLYNVPVIIFGLVYIYLPFMLFPLAQGISMIPDDARYAAADMGASRWQIFKEVELPLAAPGIVVGSLLTFVLAAGAVAESKLLGGQAVIVISDDVESAFTYGQNWPLGSALAMVLIMVISVLIVLTLMKVDLDKVMGKGK